MDYFLCGEDRFTYACSLLRRPFWLRLNLPRSPRRRASMGQEAGSIFCPPPFFISSSLPLREGQRGFSERPLSLYHKEIPGTPYLIARILPDDFGVTNLSELFFGWRNVLWKIVLNRLLPWCDVRFRSSAELFDLARTNNR